MTRAPKKKIKGGRCLICGAKEHVAPSVMTPETLYKHRITENRDCPDYEDCLTKAAHADDVMVPCIYCKNSRLPGEREARGSSELIRLGARVSEPGSLI